MVIRIFFILCVTCGVHSQYGHSYGQPGPLTRIPGYHPVNTYPEFLTHAQSQDSADSGRQDSHKCPPVVDDCPRSCRKLDDRRCRICKCAGTENTSSSSSHLHGSQVPPTHCFSMVMCMLTCKRGYNLGRSMNKQGCQMCTCQGPRVNQGASENKDSELTQLLEELLRQSSSQQSNGDNYDGHHRTDQFTGGHEWESGSGGLETYANARKGGSMGGASRTDSTSMMNRDGDGRGESSSSGCSGPMCPGNSGTNPMYPGSSSEKTTSSSSCEGPFCLGQGGGMGGGGRATMGRGGMMGGGGASSGSGGCTGPFCISGGMMGGTGGGMGGAGGGMGGTVGGMGGAGGGMGGSGMGMGGGMGGGVGGFSPFGLAASGGSNTGCTGPFCTTSNTGTSPKKHMETINTENLPSSCTGPECSAKDGQRGNFGY